MRQAGEKETWTREKDKDRVETYGKKRFYFYLFF